MNNYYPLTWVRAKLGDEAVNTMTVTPGERKDRSYCFADETWERLIVKTNSRHNITHVAFTPKYKGVWLSLKRAKRNWYKACWHLAPSDRQGL